MEACYLEMALKMYSFLIVRIDKEMTNSSPIKVNHVSHIPVCLMTKRKSVYYTLI